MNGSNVPSENACGICNHEVTDHAFVMVKLSMWKPREIHRPCTKCDCKNFKQFSTIEKEKIIMRQKEIQKEKEQKDEVITQADGDAKAVSEATEGGRNKSDNPRRIEIDTSVELIGGKYIKKTPYKHNSHRLSQLLRKNKGYGKFLTKEEINETYKVHKEYLKSDG